MKLRTLGVAVLGAVGLAALPACNKEEATPQGPARPAPVQGKAAPKPKPEPTAAAQPAPQPLTGGGTVRGAISFKGVPPTPAAVAPSDDPACDGMASSDQSVRVKDGKLENVLVRVRGLVPAPRPTQPVVVDQHQCTYLPRVQGATVGQPILIKNSDGTLHNARALNGTKSIFNVAQPPLGKPVQRPLPGDVERVRFKCDIHPWMAAWVVVNSNPFFATSGADGSFSIAHLPAGTHTLEAWHETLGTRTAEVTVKEGETVSVSFEFSAPAQASASGGAK
jgi:plastocyanin